MAAAEERPYCLVLEYLDTTLEQLRPDSYGNNQFFMARLFRALLGGVAAFGKTNSVWTGEFLSITYIQAIEWADTHCCRLQAWQCTLL